MNSVRFVDEELSVPVNLDAPKSVSGGSRPFWISKRAFDVLMSLALSPLLLLFAVTLLILNQFLNKGPLFYAQKRMGKDCKPFTAVKFRSMICAEVIERGADDPIELDRITKLGRFLRKSRIDELPQILNVIKGEMSLIGPRPDYYSHALEYCIEIPNYASRHSVRPGISGLAQVRLGYIQGINGTREKANVDQLYIQNASFRQDTSLVLETIQCVLRRSGA